MSFAFISLPLAAFNWSVHIDMRDGSEKLGGQIEQKESATSRLHNGKLVSALRASNLYNSFETQVVVVVFCVNFHFFATQIFRSSIESTDHTGGCQRNITVRPIDLQSLFLSSLRRPICSATLSTDPRCNCVTKSFPIVLIAKAQDRGEVSSGRVG